jgi:hypothetical protein
MGRIPVHQFQPPAELELLVYALHVRPHNPATGAEDVGDLPVRLGHEPNDLLFPLRQTGVRAILRTHGPEGSTVGRANFAMVPAPSPRRGGLRA